MLEDSLLDRYLRRAYDYNDKPHTQTSLVQRCRLDIEFEGPDSCTEVRVKGTTGYGLKKHRRLFPSGPLGEVKYESSGFLRVEFPSVALLAALTRGNCVDSPLATYYTNHAEEPYPQHMPLELAIQFAHKHLKVEIDPEAIEILFRNYPPNPYIGNSSSHLLICDMLEIERVAIKRRWKSVNLQKWQAAGLAWPLERRLERRAPAHVVRSSTAPQEPVSRLYRLTQRQAKLLLLFAQTDEIGKQHIEQSAAMAAVAHPKPVNTVMKAVA